MMIGLVLVIGDLIEPNDWATVREELIRCVRIKPLRLPFYLCQGQDFIFNSQKLQNPIYYCV